MTTKYFKSLLEFSEHLAKAATVEIFALEAGLELAAKAIKADAKKQIGHLQPQVGPFPEWEELAESTKTGKERMVENGTIDLTLNAEYNPLMLTGELYRSIEYEVDMSKMEAIIGTKNPIAVFQEFGTKYIPPRPFMGTAAFKTGPLIAKMFGKAAITAIAHNGFGQSIKQEIAAQLGYTQDIEL